MRKFLTSRIAAPHRCSHPSRRERMLSSITPVRWSAAPCRAAPHEVVLTFTQNLEAAFSTAQVTDASGARVDQGKAAVSGNTMTIGLKALGPGSYKVHWHVLSVDTHSTEGTFTFHVGGH